MNHERLCKLNPNRQFTPFADLEFQRNKIKLNQWTKAKERGTVYVMSNSTKDKLSKKARLNRHTEETKALLSRKAKERGLGGHTSKRNIHFQKKDGSVVYLQSSYEISFATLLEQLNIEWSRPSPLKWIDDKGIEHNYYPDFKVGNVYLDTKNDYLAKIDARKIELVKQQNNIDIRIVLKSDISEQYIKELPF